MSLFIIDREKLYSASARCVKCAMCTASCPSYHLNYNENYSPRGRITLIQGLLKGDLTSSKTLKSSLYSCLLCRACESVCPSNVPFAALMDASRTLLKQQKVIYLFLKIFLLHSTGKKIFRWLFMGYQKLGLQWFLDKSSFLNLTGLKRLTFFLPQTLETTSWQEKYPAIGHKKGTVGLFIGCMSGFFDTKTVNAAIKVLTVCGYDVLIPPQQTCCGAIHQHAGELKKASQLAIKNSAVFNLADMDHIVYLATGCADQMQQYQNSSFTSKLVELCEFLEMIQFYKTIKLADCHKKIMVHYPCSSSFVVHKNKTYKQLLRRIPKLNFVEMPQTSCCGAAGTFMLTHGSAADTLGNEKAQQIIKSNADLVTTINIGCMIHLQARLKDLAKPIEVIHPAVLLYELMQN